MKYLVLIFCVSLVACQGLEHTIPAQIRQADEARQRSDSILNAFKRVNEELRQSSQSVLNGNDAALRRLDSLAKAMDTSGTPPKP